jgi:archaellum component FlaC
MQLNDTMETTDEHTEPEIKEMFTKIMGKLAKLDEIDHRVKSIESDLKDMKKSIEFVHGEVNDLKEENKIRKEKQTFSIFQSRQE